MAAWDDREYGMRPVKRRKRCRDHWLGRLQCVLKQGHRFGPVYWSSQTRDRHGDD